VKKLTLTKISVISSGQTAPAAAVGRPSALRLVSKVGPYAARPSWAPLSLSAVRVRIRSRSTSAKPPRTAITSRPVLVPVSAHGSARERNCALAAYDLLDDGESVEGAARKAVDARDDNRVAGRNALQHLEKLTSVVVRPGRLLVVNLDAARAAQLLKLGVKRLPVGADAGIAEATVLGGEFRSYLTGNVTR
jgi:hypothetical protein